MGPLIENVQGRSPNGPYYLFSDTPLLLYTHELAIIHDTASNAVHDIYESFAVADKVDNQD